MTYLKLSVMSLVVACVALLSAPITNADAATYHWNPAAAVTYADIWSCNYGSCPNPNYQYLGNDCTNFMSQAMIAGGFHTAQAWYPYNVTWAYVRNLDQYLTGTAGLGYTLTSYSGSALGAAYTAALASDIYMYDWGKGSGFSHMSMEAGWAPGHRCTLPTDRATSWTSTQPTVTTRRGITGTSTQTAPSTERTCLFT
jgi:hypothetical protein